MLLFTVTLPLFLMVDFTLLDNISNSEINIWIPKEEGGPKEFLKMPPPCLQKQDKGTFAPLMFVYLSGHLTNQDTSLIRTPHSSGHCPWSHYIGSNDPFTWPLVPKHCSTMCIRLVLASLCTVGEGGKRE